MDLRVSIAAQTAFGLRLAKHVGSGVAAAANLVFSPLSLHVVLSLLAAGCKGPTLDQIATFLGASDAAALTALASQVLELVLSDGSAAGAPRVSVVSGVWVDSSLSLRDSFKEIVASAYKAETESVDFRSKAAKAAIDQVNSWVANATSGLITELLPPGSIDDNTRLVLGNALYFKGSWTRKFDAAVTKDGVFHLLDGTSVQVPFMTSWRKQFLSSHGDFKVLRLPYKPGEDARQFSMYIFLPDARDGLWSLAENLSSNPEFLNHHLPMEEVEVGVFKVPKFKISFEFEASQLLRGLGLDLPFSDLADLTGMVDAPPLEPNIFVSSIFHKSVIEFAEEGTEAAAASGMPLTGSCLVMDPPIDFAADHPFMFLIREDKAGVVLFVGHVLNPLLAA